MALPKFMQQVETQVVLPAIARNLNIKSGRIVNSYYGKVEDKSGIRSSGSIFVDIAFADASGQMQDSLIGVPMVRIGGVSQSLPIIGTIAIIAFVDGNGSQPVVLGTIDTAQSMNVSTDHKAPVLPPKMSLK